MTSETLQPEPLPDLAVGASPSRASSFEDPAPGPLLRALLAGAVALLVLLLPGQLAASRSDDGRSGCWGGACALGGGAALDGPSNIEIRRRDIC